MTDLDQFRAELAGSLAGLSPSQRLKAGREMADRLGVVLAAIERGEIDASATETARLQGAASTPSPTQFPNSRRHLFMPIPRAPAPTDCRSSFARALTCLRNDPNETPVGTIGGHVRNLRSPSGVTP